MARICLARNETTIPMETAIFFDHSLSAEVVAKNAVLLTAILVRVPPKTLVRFKCVSKRWLSLISDSKFSNNHTRKNLNTPVSGLYIDSHPLVNFNTESPNCFPKLDFLTRFFRVKPTILHSCNGLMLCSCGPEMVVCNLTTQKFELIPSFSFSSLDSIVGHFLSFYPSKSLRYKIVLVSRKNCCCLFLFGVNIYFSESGIWERINFSELGFDLFTHNVLYDGVINWICNWDNLVRFDIDGEKLTTTQITFDPLILGENIKYLGEFGGCLFLVHTSNTMETEFQILEMDMHNFRWNIKYNVNLDPVIDTFYVISNWSSVNILCFKGGNQEETPILLLVICEKIVSYNPTTNCLEILQDSIADIDEMDFELFSAHKFIESMASI